jgi:hypothetical protein
MTRTHVHRCAGTICCQLHAACIFGQLEQFYNAYCYLEVWWCLEACIALLLCYTGMESSASL